jgi:hypothetical protein
VRLYSGTGQFLVFQHIDRLWLLLRLRFHDLPLL